MTTPEEAKLWRDKHVLERIPNANKATAVALAGVSPENYESIKEGKLTPEEARKELNLCFQEILMFIDYYMDMPDNVKKMVALWIIGTYFHEQFNTYPYLFFNAMRGSGKTRLLKIISALGYKGDGSVQNNLTEAVLFRIPRNTTTCIDEMEQVGSKEKQTLRELLNSAYKKGMKVKRMKKVKNKDGESQEVETYEPYFPIAMANIWGMDEVLGDRSISFILEKSDNPMVTKKVEDFEDNDHIISIKRTLEVIQCSLCSVVMQKNITKAWNNYITGVYMDKNYTTTLTTYNINNYTTTLHTDTQELFEKIDKSGISGRNFELMFPLLLIAKELGKKNFEEILQIISELVNTRKEDEYSDSKDVAVYDFIAHQDSARYEFKPIKQLVIEFRTFLGDSDEEDRWLNDRWFGRALKRLGLLNQKKRVASGILVLLNVDKAKEKIMIFRRTDLEVDNESRDKGV